MVARITGNLLVSESEQQDGRISVRLVVENHSDLIRSSSCMSSWGEGEAVSPRPGDSWGMGMIITGSSPLVWQEGHYQLPDRGNGKKPAELVVGAWTRDRHRRQGDLMMRGLDENKKLRITGEGMAGRRDQRIS